MYMTFLVYSCKRVLVAIKVDSVVPTTFTYSMNVGWRTCSYMYM